MIQFEHPEAFLLGVVVVVWLRRKFWVRPLVGLLRCAVLIFALALLAQPYLAWGESGRDLILLLDRSRSMPEHALARAHEVADLAAEQAEPGDRIGLVVFGRDAVVETPPRADYQWSPPAMTVDRDATDLSTAIDTALALVPPGRQATILIVSDGESTGADPGPTARSALRRGVRIDAIPIRREAALDLAVEEISTPDEVGSGEPFAFSAWVRSDREVKAPFRLLRDGVVIGESEHHFRAGLNRLRFRDNLAEPGIHHYEIALDLPGDRVAENNRARAVTRVSAPFRVLCVTPGGRNDRLTGSLTAAGLEVRVAGPSNAPLDLDGLDGFRAVVLENVAAADLPPGSLESLAHWVRNLGGGLLMTGGGASFGPGGYHRSHVEEVLPVSMEIREEQRKFALAMAIALDRSGSMALPVATGEIKMDLANLGACAAVDLLGRADHIAVIAVDSSPHIVVEAQPVEDKNAIQNQIRGIESAGGGIYTYTALQASVHQLVDTPQLHKHIVLFADAADAEEPGDYKTQVPKWVNAGVTVSVIGLGSSTDPDAAFLEDLALLGGGRCFFVDDAVDLPRVFAQETIQVARSSMVEQETLIASLPDLVATGLSAQQPFPTVGGYSIAYAKPDAQVGAVTDDDQRAPFVSFWQHGLGRAAAFLGEADGELSGGLAAWPEYADTFATLVRWLAGTEADADLFATMTRQGHEGVLTVEVEAGKEGLLGQLEARLLGPDGRAQTVFLTRTGQHTLEARFPLRNEGAYRAAVGVGAERFVRVPPVILPYSPEFERQRDPRAGEKALAAVAEIAEGRLDPPAAELFAGSRHSAGLTHLNRLCAWLAVLALLLEIAVRRLRITLAVTKMESLPSLHLKWRRKRSPGSSSEQTAPRLHREPEPMPQEEVSEPAPTRDLGSVLDRAKQRAQRRKS